MGISSDGILYFGFQVGGEDEKPEWLGEYDDFEDWLIGQSDTSEDAPYEDRKKVIEACPADLQLFCSYDYPMYVLGVRGAEYRAYRGDIVEIGHAELSVDQMKVDAFRGWCIANGIEWREPKWLLCSMYGR